VTFDFQSTGAEYQQQLFAVADVEPAVAGVMRPGKTLGMSAVLPFDMQGKGWGSVLPLACESPWLFTETFAGGRMIFFRNWLCGSGIIYVLLFLRRPLFRHGRSPL
jgi:hypothetical protein